MRLHAIQSDLLDGTTHGFFTRAGGVSEGIYAGLNGGPGSNDAPAAVAQDASLMLEEVLVTARKRIESIQDVPVSVTSISQELKEASLRRLDDIQSLTPNVYIRTTAGIPGGAA